MSELLPLHNRNKLLIKIFWALVVLGLPVSIPNLGINSLILGFCALFLCGVPTLLIWKNRTGKYMMYTLTVCLMLYIYITILVAPDMIAFCFSYVVTALLSLYFNYRPVLVAGIGNIAMTIYFYQVYGHIVFPEGSIVGDLPPLIVTHIILTAAIVAQSILGEKLRVQSTKWEADTKTDALTSLYNHKMFHEQLSQLLGNDDPENLQLQLAVMDIDNFKQVNDMYGHSVGDQVLRRVADTLTQQVTPEDIVARYGGEEFSIIFRNKSMDKSIQLVQNICTALVKLKHPEMDNKSITLSIGLKNYEPHINKEELFKQADALLYEAKRNGKNQVAI